MRQWERIAMIMLECESVEDLKASYGPIYNRLATASSMVEKAGGQLKSRQAIAIIITEGGWSPGTAR